MGWRLRRSFKIGPGVRLNISRSGVGVSAGVKGLRVGIGPGGAYTSMGIPGTGIYRIDYLGRTKPRRKRRSRGGEEQARPMPFEPMDPPKGVFWPVMFLAVGLFFAFRVTIQQTGDVNTQTGVISAAVFGLPSLFLLWLRLRDPRRAIWKLLQSGKALAVKGNLIEAMTRFEKAVSLDTTLEEAHYFAGLTAFGLEDYERAVFYLKRFHPSIDPDLSLYLANSLFNLGRYDEAINILQGIAGGIEDNVKAATLLGLCFAAKGDNEAAIEVYQRGPVRKRRMDAEMADLRYAYAVSLAAGGDHRRARNEFKKVLTYDQDFRDVQERLRTVEAQFGPDDSSGEEEE